VVAKVYLDLVDLFDDLFGVGFDIGADEVEVFAVVFLVEEEILLEVGQFDIDLCDADLHVDPDRYYGDQKSQKTDRLSQGHSEDGVFGLHTFWLLAVSFWLLAI